LRPLLRLTVALAVLALTVASPAAEPLGRLQAVTVTDQLVLPARLPDGSRLREVSGLAWDTGSSQLLMVSDRGRLLRWTVRIELGRMRLHLVHATALGAGVDAESLDVVDGMAVVADEASGTALWLAADSRPQRRSPLPGDLPALPPGELPAPIPGAQAAPRHGAPQTARPAAPQGQRGVEAIAWHAAHGLLAVPQAPAGRPPGTPGEPPAHTVAAEDGTRWRLPAGAGLRAHIKAAHLLAPDRLLLLERQQPKRGAQRWLLREVALESCRGGLCDSVDLPLNLPPGMAGDNFEGLACPGLQRCLLVSDDGTQAQPRTLLLLLHLHRKTRP
jgi:hypothetical protein